jgi:hypothetical protein
MTPPDDPGLFRVIALPLAIVGGVGALNLAAGLLMLYSPALNAFFKHQREGPDLLETVDALNAASGGGEPTTVDKVLGKLAVPSGTLILGDPQYLPQFEVPGIVDEEVEISAQLWQYPSGAAMVTAVLLKFGDGVYNGPPARRQAAADADEAFWAQDRAEESNQGRGGRRGFAAACHGHRDVPENDARVCKVSLHAFSCADEQQLRSSQLPSRILELHPRRQLRPSTDVHL